ncbi:MAG TPA: replicative DNA helicase [Clostridium sp.]|nr:replicative DNA helicase [Clostridium sp.]
MKADNTHALPHSITCEQELLSGIFYNPKILSVVVDNVEADDFYETSHKIIFSALKELYIRGENINLTQILESIKKDNLEKVGGVSYVTDIMMNGFEIDPLQYINILKDKSYRRFTIKKLQYAVKNMYDESSDAYESIEETFSSLINKAENKTSIIKDNDLLENTLVEIENRVKTGSIIPGMKTGFYSIDKNIGGFMRGELDIISGRPSMGKTMFALNIADGLGDNGYKIFLCELEMTEKAVGMRRLSYTSSVEVEKMRFGKLSEEEISKILNSTSKLVERNSIYTDTSASQSLVTIRAKAKTLKHMYGLDVIIIDHLSLMNIAKSQNRDIAIGEVTRGLKIMAKELDVCIILICQLSRAVEQRNDKRPMLSDLRESGNIEQDADMVMFLYRDEYYNKYSKDKGILECIIGKQRNGRIGTIRLGYDERFQKISDIN